MRKTEIRVRSLCALLAAALVLSCSCLAMAEEETYAQTLVIEDGLAQPMLRYSGYLAEGYDNADSDILRFTVYVETDYDTDADGLADLVKVFMQVPRAAVAGSYQAAVIYDPTPYNAGTLSFTDEHLSEFYTEERFDYSELYAPGRKRVPDGTISTMEQALSQDPSEWDYEVPMSGYQGYMYGMTYDYFLIRGFAVAECSGIGTLGSEGFELCGFDLERDAHKCVVEWLAGDRVAYADREGSTQIEADWSNGKVAMTGASYGGTLPYEVATTGVEGLETIIPYAGIASWYDYTNSQGVAKHYDVNYADALAAFNGGALLLQDGEPVVHERYGSWLYTVAQDEEETNGKYAPIWAATDYSDDWEQIRCSALVVHGLNDLNVTTRQSDLMAQAFEKAGQKCSLVLHQDGHNNLYGKLIDGQLWDDILNEWLCHYLYGVENGAEDLPAVMVQSNVDGSWTAYDSWRPFGYTDAPVLYEEEETTVTTDGFLSFCVEYGSQNTADGDMDRFFLSMPEANAAVYEIDIPEGTTIYGVPKIGFEASTSKEGFSGLMISAALIDTIDGETPFPAYMTEAELHDMLETEAVALYDMGGGYGELYALSYVQKQLPVKAFTFGWTDLAFPGGGEASSGYTDATYLEAGKAYSYTFYMQPTVYTVAPGHHLLLVLYTWDPYTNAILDDSPQEGTEEAREFYNYDMTVENGTLRVELPVR